jgi:hypothetical protein
MQKDRENIKTKRDVSFFYSENLFLENVGNVLIPADLF